MEKLRSLYIIEFNGLYKIGVSNNPIKRLKQLSLGPKAKIIYQKEFPNIFLVEKAFHDYFDDKRVSSEWFGLSEEDVNFISSSDFSEMLID